MSLFNWKLRIDYFRPLTEADLSFFAPPGELYRVAASYNAALKLYIEGQEAQAMAALEQICRDYPLFPQANHLYGVLLGAEGKFLEAENYLGRAHLLEMEEEESQQLAQELNEARRAAAAIRRENAKIHRREWTLAPVKKQIALSSILQQAPSLDQETSDSIQNQPSLIFENPQEKGKTVVTIIVSVGLGILLLLIFFFYWRPAIKAGQALEIERIEKLAWLENELHERAGAYPEIGRILEDYQAWLGAGRPSEPSQPTGEAGQPSSEPKQANPPSSTQLSDPEAIPQQTAASRSSQAD